MYITNEIQLAEYIATKLHAGQLRRHSLRGEARPYIYHPGKVVELLVNDGHESTLLAAAWLHDIIEDCEVSFATLEKIFGFDVATLVYQVSHPIVSGNRKERWQLYLSHYKKASRLGKILKLADRICNLREYIDFWDQVPETEKFFLKEVYLLESRGLVIHLGDSHETFRLILLALINHLMELCECL